MPSKQPNVTPLKAGVSRHSRSSVYARKALYKKKEKYAGKPVAAKATAETKTVSVGGSKNGQKRVVPVVKASRWYPAEDVPKPKLSRKAAVKTPKLRASITPGTVLILLAGRFRGKRVVFLKQLKSGMLLVTGPFKINGVPLRRVNQAFVIATKTKVDLSGVKVPETIDDAYFKKEASEKKKASAEALLGDKTSKKQIAAKRVADQKTVDSALLSNIKKVAQLKAYLNASFALSKGQAPHKISF